jgi:hypothetical protein
MANLIKGRKPTFGDVEQIEWLKRQARLSAAFDRGRVDAELANDAIPSRRIKDQITVVSFTCPGCLRFHHFSVPIQLEVSNYTAPCGATFRYLGEEELLQLKSWE